MNTLLPRDVSRRDFVRLSAVTTGAAVLARLSANKVMAATAGSDRIRVGLVGCGGRGTGAAQNCLDAAPGVEIVALADLFQRQVEGAKKKLKVASAQGFWGFDAFRQLLATDIDLVTLATPPGFRPMHFEAAVAAGKHVFMEKPVAVDPVGCRAVIATAQLARQRKLAVVAGTQRRHQPSYIEIMQRIHGGDLGELVGGQCYWNGEGIWFRVWDHFAVEMEYANGARVTSMCRHTPKSTHRVGERVVGTRGSTDCTTSIKGEKVYPFSGSRPTRWWLSTRT